MGTIMTGVVWGWLGRRALELGGLATFLFQLFEALPPGAKQAVMDLLTGHPERVSVVALFGVGSYLWSQWMSFRSTTKDQVVSAGQKIAIKELPKDAQTIVKAKTATAVEKRPTLADRIGGLFGKR